MSELQSLLEDLGRAIAAARSKFRASPPATAAELREALGELPADLAAWFAWHAGSRDALLPDTSVRLATVPEVCTELAFLRQHPPTGGLPGLACPLLTDTGGGLWLYVAAAGGAELWRYDRGDVLGREPFFGWVRSLRDRWVAEGAVLRLDFVRVGRSMLGWEQVELPLKAKKKLLGALDRAADGTPVVLRSLSGSVTVRPAPAAGWENLVLDLTPEAARELREALAKDDSAAVPGVDLRLSLSER